MKLKFGKRVDLEMPHRPGLGKKLSECRTLRELSEYHRLAERAATDGVTAVGLIKCPHCHRKIDINLIDGLVMVPNQEGDPVSTPGRVVSCPHVRTGCGRQFKMTPKPNWHFEEWP